MMSTVRIDLDQELVALMHQTNQPIENTAREMIVLEMYRRGIISSGKAAELLQMARLEFIQYTSRLGLPHLDMTDDEWKSERERAEKL